MVAMNDLTISVRVAWPFWRLLPDLDSELGLLRTANVDVHNLVDPNLRLKRSLAGTLLDVSIRKMNDPLLGLRAGATVEPGDLGPLSLAARTSDSLREALNCNTKFLRLLDDGLETTLSERGDRALWRFKHHTDRQHPASIDFALAASLANIRLYVGQQDVCEELRIPHRAHAQHAEYEQILGTKVSFGKEATLVLKRHVLDYPLVHRNKHLHKAFTTQAEAQLRALPQSHSLTHRVQQEIRQRLGQGPFDVDTIAKSLCMTPSTLRRHLADEQVTHTGILDEVRRQQALTLLQRREQTISEVAFKLGYATLPAFSKAFRRWMGQSPQAYRQHFHQARTSGYDTLPI